MSGAIELAISRMVGRRDGRLTHPTSAGVSLRETDLCSERNRAGAAVFFDFDFVFSR